MVMSFSGGTDGMVAEFGADLSFPVLSDTTGEIMSRWDKDGAVPSQSLLAPGLALLQVDEVLDDATMKANLPFPE